MQSDESVVETKLCQFNDMQSHWRNGLILASCLVGMQMQ